VINIVQSCTGTGRRRSLPDQAISLADECIFQADKCDKHVSIESIKLNGIWWIDRVLIMLAVILFIMTVTSQLWIYLEHLEGGM